MPDNSTMGSTDLIATDEVTTLNGGAVAAVKAQRVKVGFGVDGALQDVTSAAPLPVSGAFFQATQPVSIATMPSTPVTGTFFQTTQPVSIATMPSTPVTGTFFQTTQPVSGTVNLTPSTLAVTATAAANTAVTLTLPAVAGQFHYITGIEIMRTATAALAGTATLVVTTTNLPGSLAWSIGNAMTAGGTANDKMIMLDNPLKSSVVNTATTIAMPAPGAAVLWRANCYYFTGP